MANSDVKMLEALIQIEKELSSQERGLESIDIGDICKKYESIKPLLLSAISFIEKFPGGAGITAAIRLLMGLADLVCPKT